MFNEYTFWVHQALGSDFVPQNIFFTSFHPYFAPFLPLFYHDLPLRKNRLLKRKKLVFRLFPNELRNAPK